MVRSKVIDRVRICSLCSGKRSSDGERLLFGTGGTVEDFALLCPFREAEVVAVRYIDANLT